MIEIRIDTLDDMRWAVRVLEDHGKGGTVALASDSPTAQPQPLMYVPPAGAIFTVDEVKQWEPGVMPWERTDLSRVRRDP